MASNGSSRGQMRPHSNRSPPFLVIGLLVVIFILGFNYWNLSSRNSHLMNQLTDLQEKYRLVALRKISAEKRNDALMERIRESEDSLEQAKRSGLKKDQDFRNLQLSSTEQLKMKDYDLQQHIVLLNNCTETAKNNAAMMNSDLRRVQEECKAATEELQKQTEEYKSKVVDCTPLVSKDRLRLFSVASKLFGTDVGRILGEQSLDEIQIDGDGRILNPDLLRVAGGQFQNQISPLGNQQPVFQPEVQPQNNQNQNVEGTLQQNPQNVQEQQNPQNVLSQDPNLGQQQGGNVQPNKPNQAQQVTVQPAKPTVGLQPVVGQGVAAGQNQQLPIEGQGQDEEKKNIVINQEGAKEDAFQAMGVTGEAERKMTSDPALVTGGAEIKTDDDKVDTQLGPQGMDHRDKDMPKGNETVVHANGEVAVGNLDTKNSPDDLSHDMLSHTDDTRVGVSSKELPAGAAKVDQDIEEGGLDYDHYTSTGLPFQKRTSLTSIPTTEREIHLSTIPTTAWKKKIKN